jgi:DNA-binding CsgD family transcriptional regulator
MQAAIATVLEGPPTGGGRLVERELELARLGAAVERARRGCGALVVVEGHAGLGKSRLLEAASESARRAGVTVLGARGSELEAGAAHGVVLQLLEPCLARASAGERTTLLAGAAARAEPLLAGRGLAPGDQIAHALCHALSRVVSNLAERAPVLLVVDDAQWADEASLRFLAYLAARLDRLPVALAVVVEPTRTGASRLLLERLATEPAADVVLPAPLSPAGVASMLRNALGRDPDEAFARACAQVTGGIPFLVRELGRGLARERIAPRAASASRVLATGTDSIARTVLHRLARLPDGALGLARAISVLGDGTPLRHAAALAGLDASVAGAAVDALATEGVLAAGEPLRFVQPVVRNSIYAQLPCTRRAELHARAAHLLARDGLPAERIGAQLVLGAAQGEPWTVEVLETAAARALDRGATRSAARYLRRALDEPPVPARRAGVLRALGNAEVACGDARAAGRFEEAAELAACAPDRATALGAAGHALSEAGRTREAAAAFDRALAVVREAAGDAPGEAARCAGEAAGGPRCADPRLVEPLSELAVRFEAGYLTAAHLDPVLRPRALERLRALAPIHRRPATRGGRALLAHAAHEAALEGRPRAKVVGLARRALGDARDPEDFADGATRRLAVGALLWVDELGEAQRVLDPALEHARLRGWAGVVASASRWRARLLLRRGLVAEALADLEAAEREGGGLMGSSRPALAPLKAAALIERGELEHAAGTLEAAVGREEQLDAITAIEVVAARATLRLAQGRPRLALQDFVDCGARLDAAGIRNPAVVPWRSGAALASARLGDPAQARRLAGRELELAREADAPRAVAVALRAAALAQEHPERRVALLREAAEAAGHAGDILGRAHALCRLGAELRDAHAGAEGVQALRESLELAETGGATALGRCVREELAAAGVRAGRAPRNGTSGLTPGERRVAELAARGLTNREIAQALFVTVKTVEWHLRNVFVKLRIGSRRELRPVLRHAA